jgi:hypothetical protein
MTVSVRLYPFTFDACHQNKFTGIFLANSSVQSHAILIPIDQLTLKYRYMLARVFFIKFIMDFLICRFFTPHRRLAFLKNLRIIIQVQMLEYLVPDIYIQLDRLETPVPVGNISSRL